MPSPALTVALAAGALLVLVVGADASMNRYWHLEALVEDNWVKVATHPFDPRYGRHAEISFATFDLNRTDSVEFRVRAENGYPWGVSRTVEVRLMDQPAFKGQLSVGARAEASVSFTLPGERLLETAQWEPPRDATRDRYAAPHFQVLLGDERFGGTLSFREVPK